jgi:hypothetical protein
MQTDVVTYEVLKGLVDSLFEDLERVPTHVLKPLADADRLVRQNSLTDYLPDSRPTLPVIAVCPEMEFGMCGVCRDVY